MCMEDTVSEQGIRLGEKEFEINVLQEEKTKLVTDYEKLESDYKHLKRMHNKIVEEFYPLPNLDHSLNQTTFYESDLS
jgi:hypothetical protein